MALNGNALGDAIKAAVDGLSAAQAADRTVLFRTMGNAIVSYITANSSVSITITGVQPGAAALLQTGGSIT